MSRQLHNTTRLKVSFEGPDYGKFTICLLKRVYRESVAGSVIQATGTVEFEDGLWIGNHLKGSKWPAEGLYYTLGSTGGGAHTRVPPGQTEFQSAWVLLAAWC